MKILSMLFLLVSCNCATVIPKSASRADATAQWTLTPASVADSSATPLVVQKGKSLVAHVQLEGDVDVAMADYAEAMFIEAIKQKADSIYLELDSEGGQLPSGFRISKLIEKTPLPVVCVVDGLAASMMFYILQSCDIRVMTKRSYLMAHQPMYRGSAPGSGSASDWQNIADDLKATTAGMIEHLCRKMKITPEQLTAKIPGSTMWFMNWPEALKVGAVDGVVETSGDVRRAMRNGAPLPMLKSEP